MTWQRSIQAAIRELKKEESSIGKQLDVVQRRIQELEDLGTGAASTAKARPNKRRLSTKGRAAISRAAKKRWAKYRAEQRA